MHFIRKFFQRPIRAWKAGGWYVRLSAAYAIGSPLVVMPMAATNLTGFTDHSWWIVVILLVIGHFNSLVVLPGLMIYHDRCLQKADRSAA